VAIPIDTRNSFLVLAGLLAVLPIAYVLEFVEPDFGQNIDLLYLAAFVRLLIGFSIGGYIARNNFTGPAVALGIGAWIFITASIFGFAAPVFDLIVDIVTGNLVGLAIFVTAAVAGAQIGMRCRTWLDRTRRTAT